MKQWITNEEELATTELRKDALAILSAGLEAIDTRIAVREEVTYEKDTKTVCFKDLHVCLRDYERIFFVAIGKCALDASLEMEEILGDAITAGYVLDISGGVFKKLISRVGTHPFPSEQNMEATEDIVKLLSGTTERDLVIVVISGGGSALLCSPYNISCETLTRITKTMMQKGATIEEVNTVRKHLSKVQGGQLAKIAHPARVVALIFSDVPGDDLSLIASGPVTKDNTTSADAERLLLAYDVMNLCEIPECSVTETPKEDKYFEHVSTILLVNNQRGLVAMQKKASALGYEAIIKDAEIQGEARSLGEMLARQSLAEKSVYLYGGETTVTVAERGKGGRNQEVALGALSFISPDSLVLACASDGHDNSDVAGAIADEELQKSAKEKNLHTEDFLSRNDSYHFFETLGAQIKTGTTGANVSDFYFVIRK
jgi:glycerate-2-kinase